MNQCLVIRNADCKPEHAWELDGPVVFCQEVAGTLLVLTMGMDKLSHYTLWRLGIGNQADQLELPDTLSQYCYTPSQVYWVTNAGELYACGPQLKPRMVGHLSLQHPDLLAVSADHRFVAVASYHDSQTRLQVWENSGDEMICP